MSFNTRDLDRTCKRLRSVIYTDDAGLNHRINRYCGNLLSSGQMYCDRCEDEIVRDQEHRNPLELDR